MGFFLSKKKNMILWEKKKDNLQFLRFKKKLPKMALNGQHRTLAKVQSPLQELEESPRSRPHLLVFFRTGWNLVETPPPYQTPSSEVVQIFFLEVLVDLWCSGNCKVWLYNSNCTVSSEQCIVNFNEYSVKCILCRESIKCTVQSVQYPGNQGHWSVTHSCHTLHWRNILWWCSAVQCSAVLCSAVQCSAVLFCAVQ